MSAGSLASVLYGQAGGYPPYTAGACIEMFDHYVIDAAERAR